MNDLMVRLNQDMHAFRELWWQIIVEEESHAATASDLSNSTASRTSSRWTSYQRATSSTDELALTLRARVVAGTPDLTTVGWPKFRRGSTMIWRSFPSGHQMMSLPENSNPFRNGSTIR